MNTELVIPEQLQQAFPTMMEGLRKAASIFDQIKSFEDIERVFLKGQGLSPNTYRSYLTAVKQFYSFTDGLNPLQVRPGDIEGYYDHLVSNVDRSTAYLRIRGLKKFFSGVRNIIPFYTSPFEIMNKKLVQKLSQTKKGNRQQAALTATEVQAVLSWLKLDTTPKGLCNYVMFYTLVTSGLRASELLQLTWKDIELREDGYYALFIGKGDKTAEQELYAPAVEACREYFKMVNNHEPKLTDFLFLTVAQFNGDQPRPMTYATMWARFKDIGINAREQGILTRDMVFSPHLCRRTYATNLYKSGMKIKAIQNKTRHASIETLTNHYIIDNEPAQDYIDDFIKIA